MLAAKLSIRLRLIAAAAVTIAVALAAAGAGLHHLFERHIERRTVSELETDVRQLMSGLRVADDGSAKVERLPGDQRYSQPFSGAYWQVLGGNGIVARSRSLWDEELELPADALPAGDVHTHMIRGPQDHRLLVVERTIAVTRSNGRLDYRLSAALDRSESIAAVTAFRSDLVLALTLLGGGLLVAFAIAVSVGLSPLAKVRNALLDLRAGEANRLIGPFPKEVEPLIDDLNDLLDKRDSSIASAQCRATDLAHGLKTPIAAISVIAEELSDQGNRETASELSDYVRGMQGHVERELIRAMSAQAKTVAPEPVSLISIIEPLVRSMQRLPRGVELTWEINVPAGLSVKVDRIGLTEVLGNLLDNARKWAQSHVLVGAEIADNSLIIEILDDGPGVPETEHGNITARGRRLNETVPGSGFGLAIAAQHVEQLGLRLELLQAEGSGFRVQVILPPSRFICANAREANISKGLLQRLSVEQ